MLKAKSLWPRYRQVALYVFFGVLTTLLNIVAYLFCYYVLQLPNLLGNVVAWLIAVTFAFITNKVWVFGSKKFSLALVAREAIKFYNSRLFTGAVDMAIMYVGVDVLLGSPAVFKIVADGISTVLNYLASRFWVFRLSRQNGHAK